MSKISCFVVLSLSLVLKKKKKKSPFPSLRAPDPFPLLGIPVFLSTYLRLDSLNTKPIDTSKFTTGHTLSSGEMKSSSIHKNADTSSPNLETFISHGSNPTHRDQTPQLRGTINLQPDKGDPKHSKLSTLKRQRTI